jgi:hypothetical protein
MQEVKNEWGNRAAGRPREKGVITGNLDLIAKYINIVICVQLHRLDVCHA